MELTRATRRDQNPRWNGNKMKLGIFGVNVSNGCAMGNSSFTLSQAGADFRWLERQNK
jgi:hypothetical protein